MTIEEAHTWLNTREASPQEDMARDPTNNGADHCHRIVSCDQRWVRGNGGDLEDEHDRTHRRTPLFPMGGESCFKVWI